MNPRERFKAVMNFKTVDRLPVMEWICWWDQTLERWQSEGLPAELGREDILRYFGMDVHERLWLSPRWQMIRPPGKQRNQGIIESENDYERFVAPLNLDK